VASFVIASPCFAVQLDRVLELGLPLSGLEFAVAKRSVVSEVGEGAGESVVGGSERTGHAEAAVGLDPALFLTRDVAEVVVGFLADVLDRVVAVAVQHGVDLQARVGHVAELGVQQLGQRKASVQKVRVLFDRLVEIELDLAHFVLAGFAVEPVFGGFAPHDLRLGPVELAFGLVLVGDQVAVHGGSQRPLDQGLAFDLVPGFPADDGRFSLGFGVAGEEREALLGPALERTSCRS
jgi:hypothetical protein